MILVVFSQLVSGRPNTCSCGIVSTIGWVNFGMTAARVAPVHGRDWAVVKGDELHDIIFFRNDDDS